MGVDVEAILNAQAGQVDPGVVSNNRLTRDIMGHLFTKNWKEFLAGAGKVFTLSVGGVSAGADVSLVTGGGAGTVIDSDQPEIIIGVDEGHYLVPLELEVSAQVDLDADAEVGNILAFADRTQAPPTSVTGSVGTPVNHLDGGPAFPGRAFHTITADITDPVVSELLGYETVRAAEFISNGTATNLTNGIVVPLRLRREFNVPSLIAGPCSLVVAWGGTAAVTALAKVTVAAVPAAWFPTS